MAKSTHVTTSRMPAAAGKDGDRSSRMTVAPVRLPQNVRGQNRKAPSNSSKRGVGR